MNILNTVEYFCTKGKNGSMVALNWDVNHNKSIIINGRNDKDVKLQNHIKFGKVISALMQKKVFVRNTFPRCTQFSSLLPLYQKKTFVTYSFLRLQYKSKKSF